MTRFDCAVIDRRGARVRRTIDARDRDHATLLLFALGDTPIAISRASPTLLARIGGRSDEQPIALLEELQAGVVAGLSLPAAARLSTVQGAHAVASGTRLRDVLGQLDSPPWIVAAFSQANDRLEEQRVLRVVAAEAVMAADRRQRMRTSLVDGGIWLVVSLGFVWAFSTWLAAGLAALIALTLLIPTTRAAMLSGMETDLHAARAHFATARAIDLGHPSPDPSIESAAIGRMLGERHITRAVRTADRMGRAMRIGGIALIGVALFAILSR